MILRCDGSEPTVVAHDIPPLWLGTHRGGSVHNFSLSSLSGRVRRFCMLLYVKKLNLLTANLSFKTQPYYSDALACGTSKLLE